MLRATLSHARKNGHEEIDTIETAKLLSCIAIKNKQGRVKK